MGARSLEEARTGFYDGRFDLLLSTQIVESGLDIPTANTLIVHRADMFGLAQLYQLRGRIGRSKLRAYCYLTLPPRGVLTTAAERRLEVMQSLDSLGAGFQLTSHDLDIRGAGNLLGEEQSGHIREVGVELYQHLLEAAVAAARGGGVARGNEGSGFPRRRLPAHEPRPRHPRGRQPGGRGTVGPYPRGRRRALPAFAGGSGGGGARRRRAGRGRMVAADQHRHAGPDPGGICDGLGRAARPL